MESGTELVRWARRVSPGQIRRLYREYAQGIVDEMLIEEVAFGLYARCQSILAVKAAKEGRITCPACGAAVYRRGGRNDPITCVCGWATTWHEYRGTFRRRQLNDGGAADVFEGFVARLAAAQSPHEKMRLIDWLIHECHKQFDQSAGTQRWLRPVAPNLIRATMEECVALLDELAYGDVAGAKEEQADWRERLREGRDWMMKQAEARRRERRQRE